MSKRFLITALAVLVVAGLAVLLMKEYTDPKHDRRGGITENELAEASHFGETPLSSPPSIPVDPARQIRLAIGSLGLNSDEQNRLLGDLIVTDLTDARGLDLVERQSLDRVLHELELNLSGLVRAKEAVRVGRLVRADWFLLGGISASPQGNAVVARIVDAHSGFMRDVTVIKADGDFPRLARELADFARQTRQAAAAPKPRVSLAIGAFADLSINNRRADLPTRLRTDLTAAYQGTDTTLLEREHVNTLLQEVRLDLAGLTKDGPTNQTMQSAMWLVDGFYQSMETADAQVELVLRVKRIFGRAATVKLRAAPGEELIRQIKRSIDAALAKESAFVFVPTRISEIKAQMNTGKELARLHVTGPIPGELNLLYAYDTEPWAQYGPKESVERRNLEEAIRAFETALLLDPENNEAKMYAAACMRAGIVDRVDEARNYYREIMASGNDEWSKRGMLGLAWTYRRTDPAEAAKWFREAGDTNNERNALSDLAQRGGTNSTILEVAEARLFEFMRSGEDVLKGKGGTLMPGLGTREFASFYGTSRAEAANQLALLLPKLKQTFPDIVPHILAAMVVLQVDTNAPVISEFRDSLQACVEHPKSLLRAPSYFQHLLLYTYDWCMANKQYALAVEIGEAKRRVAGEGYVKLEKKDKVKLAFAYRAQEKWKEALNLFESLGNQPIDLFYSDLWDRPFLPSKAVAECRAKLGLPAAQNLGQFDLGDACLHLHAPSAFAVDGSALWVALAGKLFRLDMELKTNSIIALPNDDYAPANTLCVGPEHIWIGTAGGGLIECNKPTGQCRRYTEKDGLAMNEIESLHLRDRSLWLGYGGRDAARNPTVGGLGVLDLQSGRFDSFVPSLSGQGLEAPKSAGNEPPRTPVVGIVNGRSGELCVLSTGSRLQAHGIANKTWTPLPSNWTDPAALNSDAERLFVGDNGRGVHIVGLNDRQTRPLNVQEGLPGSHVTALALDGTDLWIGGSGFVAVADLKQNKVRKVCYVSTHSVDRIQVGGGYLWVQFEGHLYRTSLETVR